MTIQPTADRYAYATDLHLRNIRSEQAAKAHKLDDFEPKTDRSEGDGEHDKHAGKTRGVIRLHESGHFGAGTEVRLRIKASQEAKEHGEERSEAVAEQRLGGLIGQVDEHLQTVLSERDLNSEALEAAETLRTDFGEALETALREFADEHDTESLGKSIKSAFKSFVKELRSLLATDDDDDDHHHDRTPDLDGPEGDDVVGINPTVGARITRDDRTLADSGRTTTATANRSVDLIANDTSDARLAPSDTKPAGETSPDDPKTDSFDALIRAFEEALAGLLEDVEAAGGHGHDGDEHDRDHGGHDDDRDKHDHDHRKHDDDRHERDDDHHEHDRGRGFRAYDGFRVIYNELRGIRVDAAG